MKTVIVFMGIVLCLALVNGEEGKCYGDNEEYNICFNKCELTCENYKDPPMCPAVCEGPGCNCKIDFVRNKRGKCVKINECK